MSMPEQPPDEPLETSPGLKDQTSEITQILLTEKNNKLKEFFAKRNNFIKSNNLIKIDNKDKLPPIIFALKKKQKSRIVSFKCQ